jgi:hypothetical protein
MIILCLLVFAFSGCYSPNPGGGAAETGAPEQPLAGSPTEQRLFAGSVPEGPLDYPQAPEAESKTDRDAKVYICGETSMMGFADWQYESIYETAFSALADALALSDKDASYYRYDAFDASDGASALASADAPRRRFARRRSIRQKTSTGARLSHSTTTAPP